MFWLRLRVFAKQHPTVLWALWLPILAFDAMVFKSLSWNYQLINVAINLVIAAVVVAEVFDLSTKYNKLVNADSDPTERFKLSSGLRFSALGRNRVLIDTRDADSLPVDHTPQIVLYDEVDAKVYILMLSACVDVKDKYTLEEEGVFLREIKMPTGETLEVHTVFPDDCIHTPEETEDANDEVEIQDELRRTIQQNIERVKAENTSLLNPMPRETEEDLLNHSFNRIPHPPNVQVDTSQPQALPVAPPLPDKKDPYLDTIWERGFGVGYQEGLQDGIAEGLEAGQEIAENETMVSEERGKEEK